MKTNIAANLPKINKNLKQVFFPSISVTEACHRIKTLYQSELHALDRAVRYDNIYKGVMYMSQDKGAHHHRVTMNKAYQKLHAIGLVKKTNRGYKKTCVYELPSFFREYGFRQTMKHLLPHLKWLPLWLLLSQATLLRNKYLINNKLTSLLTSKLTSTSLTSYLVTTKKRTSEQKRSVMERSVLMNVKQLVGLTDQGIELVAHFDDKILSTAVQRYRKKTGIRDPYKYFFNICNKVADELKIPVAWKEYYQTLEKLNIDPTKARLFEKTVPVSVSPTKKQFVAPQEVTQEDIDRKRKQICDLRNVISKMEQHIRSDADRRYQENYERILSEYEEQLTGLCERFKEIHKRESTIPSVSEKPILRSYTLMDVAQEVKRFNDPKAIEQLASLLGKPEAIRYWKKAVSNTINGYTKPLVYDPDPINTTAALYIKHFAQEHDIPITNSLYGEYDE